MAQKIIYWRMGVQYTGAKGIQWGSKRFATLAELQKATQAWLSENEAVIQQVFYRQECSYQTTENPAQ